MGKTYVFDIDNTICDTWPTLDRIYVPRAFKFFCECWRVSFIPPFPKMINCVRARISRSHCEVYFLSARHWSLWLPTYFYLIRCIGFFKPWRLILVPHAIAKIAQIEMVIKISENHVTVIDDLSYNSEKGETLYYFEVIYFLESLKRRITYVGKQKIDVINKSV